MTRVVNAWISPNGMLYPVLPLQHTKAILQITGIDEDTAIALGWLRISNEQVYHAFCQRELSQGQIDTLWDYAQSIGVDITRLFDITEHAQVEQYFGLTVR